MKAFTISFLFIFFYCPDLMWAQTNQAVLIQDVVAGAQSANPRSFVTFKDSVYFLIRQTPTSPFQINRTKLTAVNPVTIRYAGIAPDSIVSDIVRTDSFDAGNTARLWFFTKRRNIGTPSAPFFELRDFNGLTNSSINDVDFFGFGAANDAVVSIKNIRAVPRNPLSDQTIYAELKMQSGIEGYKNMAMYGGNAWTDTLDRDYLGNAMVFWVREGSFFTRNLKNRPDEDRIEYRRDNGQPSSYNCADNQATCPQTITGIAADSLTLLYYTKIGDTKRLWYYRHMDDNLGNISFTRENVTVPLGFDIGKPGIFYKGRMYFKTLNEGLWLFDTIIRDLKPVKGFKYTAPADSINYPVDSLTLVAKRAFFWAKTAGVPSGGIYEIFNDSARIWRVLNTNERVLRFIELDRKPYVLTREGAISTLYRINSNSLTEIGKVNGIDVLAGYATLNNTFVYSGNNNDGKGQEPYKLSLISICDADVTPPTFTSCPTDMTRTQNAACGIVVNWTVPTATDNCAPPSVKQASGLANGACFPVGMSTVVYTATDTSGRTATCTFKITIAANACATDQTPPIFTRCPLNITLSQNDACGTIATWQTPAATDNCTTPTIAQTVGTASGTCFPIGTTTITYTAKDASNLISTCTFSVIISANPCYNDREKPKLTCPANIVRETTQSCLAVTWSGPTVTDNCGTPTFTAPRPYTSGSCIPVGVNRITYTATDMANNQDSCSFTITVNRLNKTQDIDPTISKMTLSPNPTEGVVWVTFESQKARDMAFSVFDYRGTALFQINQAITVGQNCIALDLKELPTGFYMIRPAAAVLKYPVLKVFKL